MTLITSQNVEPSLLSVYSRNNPRRGAILVKIPEGRNRAAPAYHTAKYTVLLFGWSTNSVIGTLISSVFVTEAHSMPVQCTSYSNNLCLMDVKGKAVPVLNKLSTTP
jgi:hypothetical protein